MIKNIADFRKLFEVHFTPLVRYAYSITKDKDQSKDIVQVFFIQVWSEYSSDEIENFERYAFVAVRNKCLTWLKLQNRFLGDVPDDVEAQSSPVDKKYPEYLLESAIRKLPDKCREIFILSKQDGLTYPEIADVLNLSIKTVERQMGIGYSKLRETLTPYRDLFMDH